MSYNLGKEGVDNRYPEDKVIDTDNDINVERFRISFRIIAMHPETAWIHLQTTDVMIAKIDMSKVGLHNVLTANYFIRHYDKERVHFYIVGFSNKTVQKWAWFIMEKIS